MNCLASSTTTYKDKEDIETLVPALDHFCIKGGGCGNVGGPDTGFRGQFFTKPFDPDVAW